MEVIRLLTIGNSFSNNALTYLERIAEGTGAVRVEVGRASLGGCSLEKHWNLAQYTARVPEFKTYDMDVGPDGAARHMNLQDVLAAKPWDAITLQQASRGSWLRETFEPWLGQLIGLIRASAPQADVMLHQTWAYRDDTPYFAANAMTQKIMHRRIRESYRHYAEKYNCRILPSGDVIHRARQAPGRAFSWPDVGYDYQHADVPTLPRQDHSFAVGWQWRVIEPDDGIPVRVLDATHLNARGCYLCGGVWFETLTGLSIHDSQFCPDELAADDAAFLREIIHETVREQPGPALG